MKANRRLLALLAALAAVLLYIVASGPSTEDPVKDELVARYRLLAKYRSITEKVQGMDGHSDELTAELAAYEQRLLPGASTALGSAELQRVVNALASGSGLRLKTIKPLPLVDRGDYVEVPIQADLRGSIRAFRNFVEALEAEPLGLRVSKLTVAVNNVQKPGRLNIKIALHGLMKI